MCRYMDISFACYAVFDRVSVLIQFVYFGIFLTTASGARTICMCFNYLLHCHLWVAFFVNFQGYFYLVLEK